MIRGVRYLSDFETKKTMTGMGKWMVEKGYATASDGSLNVWVGPSAVWITVGDTSKGSLSQDMTVEVDLDENPVMRARTVEPPEEMELRLKIYRENESIRAVIHGYPSTVTGPGIQGIAIEGVRFTKTLRKLGSVPAVPCRDMDAVAQTMGRTRKSGRGILLQSNGYTTWRETLQDALGMLEAMEYYGIMLRGMDGGTPGICGTIVAALQPGMVRQSGTTVQVSVALQPRMVIQSGMATQP